MKINKLKIKNFKTIADLELSFDSKVHIFIGDNGSGKSTILEAIAFLLTNELYENMESYISWGADSFWLEMEFEDRELHYNYIVRAKKGSQLKTERRLKISTEEEPYIDSAATKKIREIIDPILTLYSAISQQLDSTSILFEKPQPRLEKLKTVLSMDKIGVISEEMKEDAKALKSKCEILKIEIKTLDERSFEKIEVPEVEDITQLQTQFGHLKKEKELYGMQLTLYNEYKGDLKEYAEAQGDLLQLEAKKKKQTEKITEHEEAKKQASTLSEEEFLQKVSELSQLEKAEAQHQVLVANYNTYSTTKTKLDSVQEKIFGLDIRRVAPTGPLTQDLLDKREQEKIIDLEMAKIAGKIDLAELGKCPTCGQDYKADGEALQLEMAQTNTAYNVVTKEIGLLNEQYDELDGKHKLLEQKLKEKELLDEQLTDYQAELANLGDISLPSQKNFNDEIHVIEDIVGKHKQVVVALKNLEAGINTGKLLLIETTTKIEMMQKIKEPSFVEEPSKFSDEVYQRIQKKINVHEQLVIERDKAIEFNDAIDEKENENFIIIEKKSEELEEFSFEQSIIEESRRCVDKEFSSYLIQRGTEYIQKKMNEFFQKTYGRYSVYLEQDKKSVNFFYSPDGKVFSPVGVSGGFERELLAISFRIALCSLQNLGIFILDEIDTAARGDMAISLYRNILTQKFDQLFCITHNSALQEYLLNEREAKAYYLN